MLTLTLLTFGINILILNPNVELGYSFHQWSSFIHLHFLNLELFSQSSSLIVSKSKSIPVELAIRKSYITQAYVTANYYSRAKTELCWCINCRAYIYIYTCHFVDLISMVIVLLHGGTNLH